MDLRARPPGAADLRHGRRRGTRRRGRPAGLGLPASTSTCVRSCTPARPSCAPPPPACGRPPSRPPGSPRCATRARPRSSCWRPRRDAGGGRCGPAGSRSASAARAASAASPARCRAEARRPPDNVGDATGGPGAALPPLRRPQPAPRRPRVRRAVRIRPADPARTRSYGMSLKAVVDALLDGDASRLRSLSVRFAGSLFPGQTIRTSVWQDGNRLVLRADVPRARRRAGPHPRDGGGAAMSEPTRPGD